MGKKCTNENCNTYASFGYEMHKPINCKNHKLKKNEKEFNKRLERLYEEITTIELFYNY